jgi:hypothetical protein
VSRSSAASASDDRVSLSTCSYVKTSSPPPAVMSCKTKAESSRTPKELWGCVEIVCILRGNQFQVLSFKLRIVAGSRSSAASAVPRSAHGSASVMGLPAVARRLSRWQSRILSAIFPGLQGTILLVPMSRFHVQGDLKSLARDDSDAGLGSGTSAPANKPAAARARGQIESRRVSVRVKLSLLSKSC